MIGIRGYLANGIRFVFETAAAAAAGTAVGLRLIPLAYELRGYYAVGGEWMAVFSASMMTYFVMHRWVFLKLWHLLSQGKIHPLEITLQGEGLKAESYSGPLEESVMDLEKYTA